MFRSPPFLGMVTRESPWEIVGEVALSMILGAAIGLEREFARRPAGLRTHMLVGGMAALLVALGNAVVRKFTVGVDPSILKADPVVIVQAIITGMSFLCAGTVFRSEGSRKVEGLTTGASLLFTSAIGICVALREFVIAVSVTALVLFTLFGVTRLETLIQARPRKESRAGTEAAVAAKEPETEA